MCAPLRRGLLPVPIGPSFAEITYEKPYGLVVSGSILSLQRCGNPDPTMLDSSTYPAPATFAGGVATWSGDGAVPRAYLPACDARLTWSQQAARIDQTSGTIYVLREPPDAGPSLFTTSSLRLPQGCGDGLTRHLTVAAGARSLSLRADGGAWKLPALAGARADVLRIVPRAEPSVAVARGARMALRTDAPARTVRWRLDGGRWNAARRSRGHTLWQVAGPALPNATRLTVAVRYAAGGHASFTLRARVPPAQLANSSRACSTTTSGRSSGRKWPVSSTHVISIAGA
jgi:hypothetical protein